MNKVLGMCYLCGRTVAVKYLRVKYVTDMKGKKQKFMVCTFACEKALEKPEGIPADIEI